jgi:hypothetical protein
MKIDSNANEHTARAIINIEKSVELTPTWGGSKEATVWWCSSRNAGMNGSTGSMGSTA